MSTTTPPKIENNLAALRNQRGLSVAWLARSASISRATIYAMEAGSYVPNTAVALRLARTLEVRVEEVFSLQRTIPAPELPAEIAELLPGSEPLRPGQPVQLCRVGKALIATGPGSTSWCLPPSDGAVAGKPRSSGKTKVRIHHSDVDFRNRVLVAGCDPGISVLARHLLPAGVELVLAHRNSSQALLLLKQGRIHIAGTHLRDEASGESNLPAIRQMFARDAVAVISYALWEEGIVTAAGNPKGIRGIGDLARKDICLVNREAGAASRLLLDSNLKRLRIDPRRVAGYERLASGHLEAASQVQARAADCCIATRAAAQVFGLGFLPLVVERYDLAIRRQHLDLPAVQAMLDTLSRSSFRRELEGVGGYDTRTAGQRML